MKKTLAPWKKSFDKPRQNIKKQRRHFANKDLYSQSYGFSSSQIWMWDLDHKEGWAPKNWCFWTVVLDKTLENPIFAWNAPLISPIFLNRSLVFPILLFSSIPFHCTLKKAFLSFLPVFGTPHSVEHIFPFLPCLSLLFFSQLFVKLPQTTTLSAGISFLWDGFGHHLLYSVINLHP